MIAIAYPELYHVGGIARYLDSFLANLPEDHPPVTVFTGIDPDREQPRRIYPGVELVHVPLPQHRFGLARWSMRVGAMILDRFVRGAIRSINFHWPPLIPGLLLPASVPVVLTAHTTYLGMSGRFYPQRHYVSQWSPASIAVRIRMEREVLRRTRRVIALTDQGRDEVRRYGYAGPVDVIPNGVDARRFVRDGTVARDVDVLFSGRIERRKGSAPMVALCRRLLARRPQLRIAIVGYGDDESWVRSELAPYGARIELPGRTPFEEMIRYYDRSRVYAATSYYEGLPGTCLEALAMGLPAVVWDLPFYHGLVREGATGHVVPVNDLDAMAARIIALVEDPPRAAAMGRRGREVVETDYDWSRLSRKVLEAIG